MSSREQAVDAVRTLLAYLEDDTEREGLSNTPRRVIDSWDEIFSGYEGDAAAVLESTFNSEDYDGIV